MDFYNDRYYINHNSTCDGTTGTFYTAGSGNTGVQNFITGVGATFTRAGTTSVTDTNPPFYLNTTTQAFVSRSSVTNNVTAYTAPFFIGTTGNGPSQSFVSRASSGTYFDSTGTLQTKTSGSGATAQRAPAYYYNGSAWVLGGTLIEPAATNVVTNNTMVGAVAGTPGTPPNNWRIGSCSGITSSIIGSGTESGINYVDVQFSGTMSALCSITVTPTAGTTSISASIGQTWTASGYFKLQAGSWGSYTQSPRWALNYYDASTTNLGQSLTAFSPIPSGSSLSTQRYTATSTIPYPTTAYIVPIFQVAYASGTAVNFTVRMGMPQLELNSNSIASTGYATSVIATSSAAVTRSADIYNQQPASYFDGTGTLYFSATNTARDNHNPTSPYADLGTLIEPAATNSIRNNMMLGAVAADGMERTTNGTFSSSGGTCSGSSCYGWTTSVNGGAGTISFTAGSPGSVTLTGDGANAASIYQAITTVSGYVYTIAVTTGSGNAVTVQAGTSAGGATLLAASSAAASATTKYQFKATGTSSYVQVNNLTATAATVTTVSVQSAGKLPTNWFLTATGGLIGTIVGVGVENGIEYIDIQGSGTANIAVSAFNLLYESGNTIAASVGQTWSESSYVKLTSGAWAPYYAPPQLVEYEINSSGTAIADQVILLNSPLPSGTALSTQRYQGSYTLPDAAAAYVQPGFYMPFSNGQTANFTVRIGMPQMEQSSYSTSAIPTFGSAVTRTADVYSNPNGGTYFNSSGVLTQAAPNVPRLDHNPVSPYLPMGILIEENRTNYNKYSQNPTQSPQFSSQNVTTTANVSSSPDGTTDASSIVDNSTSIAHYLTLQNASDLSASTAYVSSVYLHNDGMTNVTLCAVGAINSTGSDAGINCNLASGTVGTVIGAPTAYGIQALANNWYRCWISFTTASSLTSGNVAIGLTSGSASVCLPNYSGTGTGVYAYGFQTEGGANPTSYIPTSGTTVTRAQEVFTVPSTAGGGSGWLTNNIGTLGAVGSVPYLSGNFQGFGGLDDGSAANSIFVGVNSSQKRTAVTYASGNQYAGTLSPNTSYTLGNSSKIAIAFSTSGGGFEGGAADNGLFTDGAYAPPATQSRLTIGHSRGTQGDLDGWVSRIWYMPVTEPDYTLPNFTQ